MGFEIKKAVANFTWGVDNWNFNNEERCFFDEYYADDSIRELFQQNYHLDPKILNHQNNEIIENNKDGWGGSCYGMTSTEMLVKYGVPDLTQYGGDAVVNNNSNKRSL